MNSFLESVLDASVCTWVVDKTENTLADRSDCHVTMQIFNIAAISNERVRVLKSRIFKVLITVERVWRLFHSGTDFFNLSIDLVHLLSEMHRSSPAHFG